MRFLIVFLCLLASTSALAQTSCTNAINALSDCISSEQLSIDSISWTNLATFGSAFLVVSSLFLRLVAEILGLIANKTKNTWDNKIVSKLMTIVNFIAKIIGWFGGGKARFVK